MPILLPTTPDPSIGPGDPGDVYQTRFATLSGYTFGGADEYGTECFLVELTGWEGLGTTVEVQQRVGDHGGWASDAWRPARVLGVTLRLYGNSFLNVSQSVDAVINAVPLSTPATFVVNDHGLERQCDVRQEGEVQVARKGPAALVSISLIATDPRRYSTTVSSQSTGLPETTGGLIVDDSTDIDDTFPVGDDTSSGVITVTNEGNMAAPWTATLTGPVPAGATVTLSSSGVASKVLRIPDALATGRTLVLNSDARSALADGTERRRVTGTWFDLEPGVNQIAFSAPTYVSGADLSVAFRSAWK